MINEPPLQHEGKPWFHPSIKREQAEDMLSHVRKEGAFLVRMGERILGSFAITFRAENKVSHHISVYHIRRLRIVRTLMLPKQSKGNSQKNI